MRGTAGSRELQREAATLVLHPPLVLHAPLAPSSVADASAIAAEVHFLLATLRPCYCVVLFLN